MYILCWSPIINNMKWIIRFGAGAQPTEHQLELPSGQAGPAPGKIQFTLDGEARETDWAEVAPGIYSILLEGRSYDVLVSRQQADGRQGSLMITVCGRHYPVEVVDPRRRRHAGSLAAGEGPRDILAPMPGKIVKVLVAESQSVDAGEGLMVIEAMKMQNEIRASRAGRVERVYVNEGAGVETGFKLVRLR